ncbi:response regulator transcription factor [Streptosporangium sp. NPDC051023]|uniref:response regulator transcription factor n=1 Tax=Streptosporangium sp. NPDC051023 TaxID=3155410 RepID=UPI00344C333A
MIRLLLTDDHPVVRKGLRAVFDQAADMTVIGEAATGEEAVRLAPRADVVLMDLRLGTGMSGAESTRLIGQLQNPPRVLVLTTYDTDGDIFAAVEAGAAGYLLKDAPTDDLLDAIRAVARGETILAPPVAARLVTRMRSPRASLSPREAEIVALVADGLSNRRIARELFISEATVKSHLVHIYAKLEVDNRTGAVTVARRRGLLRR